jgi:hypothetical protein
MDAWRYGLKGKREHGVTRTIQPLRADTMEVVLQVVLQGVRTCGAPLAGHGPWTQHS